MYTQPTVRCTHARVQVDVHTGAYIYVHAYIQTCISKNMYICIMSYHTRAYAVYRQTCAHTCMHINTCTFTYTRSSARGSTTHCSHYNTLPCTATHCNTLQHTATHCNTLQHTQEKFSQALYWKGLNYSTLCRLGGTEGCTAELACSTAREALDKCLALVAKLTYIRTCIHTHMHTYRHTYRHACTPRHNLTFSYIDAHAHVHTHELTLQLFFSLSFSLSLCLARALSLSCCVCNTQTYINTYIHTHIIHICIYVHTKHTLHTCCSVL